MKKQPILYLAYEDYGDGQKLYLYRSGAIAHPVHPTPIPETDKARVEADPVGWLARKTGIARKTVQMWVDWVQDDCRCTATKQNGERCGGYLPMSYDTSPPIDFSVSDTLCVNHGGLSYGSRSPRLNTSRIRQEAREGKPAPKVPTKKVRLDQGIVYLIQAEGTERYKIGLTQKLEVRQSTLQKQSPFPLRLVAAIKTDQVRQLEASLHAKYKKFRVHGEWFELPAWAVAEIKGVKEC